MAVGRFLLEAARRVIAAYVLMCIAMWAFQRQLIYIPNREIAHPHQYGLADFEPLELTGADGVTVQAWRHQARKGFPTIVYFHGNGGNLSHRSLYFRKLADAGFGLVALDYRGYGHSGGTPSEQGFYMDARAVVDYAQKQLHIHPDHLICYGESIGTGVAVQMATEYRFGALVLQSPFTSLVELGKRNYPWVPVDILQVDRFESQAKLGRVNMPSLLFHGEQDRIVPVSHGKTMADALQGDKESHFFPDKGHMNLDTDVMTAAVLEFAGKHHLIME